MFPRFENGQQQQQQQQHQQQQGQQPTLSSFSQPSSVDLTPSPFSQVPPLTGSAPLAGSSIVHSFTPNLNAFSGYSLGGFNGSNATLLQPNFGIPSAFSLNTSTAGFQGLSFPQIASTPSSSAFITSSTEQGVESKPIKSVFAHFMKPTTVNLSELAPSSSISSRSYCVFFQKGSCRNGDNCQYSHEIPPITNGGSEAPSKLAAANAESRSKTICRYFLAGACLKGDSCKFLHDAKSSEQQQSGNASVVAEVALDAVPSPLLSEGLFTKKASPSHATTISFNANAAVGVSQTVRLSSSPLLPELETDSDLFSEEALTARSRRFRGCISSLPEAPISLVSIGEDLIDEEELEFASGSACIVGTLMTMCSEEEIRKRDVEMDVHILESVQDDMTKSRTDRRADPKRMVKKYQRSAAGMHAAAPSEVRPPIVLAKTADYLFSSVLDSTLVPPLDVYNFLRDRFRAIRKDFALQDQAESLAAVVHEQIARYFILSHHELCEEKEDDFQRFQNLQQISHTITSLNHYYKDLRLKNGITTPSESEFYSYEILLNMRDANKLNDRLMNLPSYIRSAPLICVARELVASFRVFNYTRFFQVLKTRATYLQRCCVHEFLWGFRSRALKIIYHGMGPVQSTFPLQSLIDILAFDDLNEALNFCESHSITIVTNEMVKTMSPINEEAKVERIRSHVLIGPPQPSRKAVITGNASSVVTIQKQSTLSEHAVQKQQEQMRQELRDQEWKSAEEQRQKEIAAKNLQEKLQLRLDMLEKLLNGFLRRSSLTKASFILRKWRALVETLMKRSADEAHRKQFQIAQQKFFEQKSHLTTLSKIARLFLTFIWLNRWRSRTWNCRRADALSVLFQKHSWFRQWTRETRRIQQFKRLANSKTAVSLDVHARAPLPVLGREQKPSFLQVLQDGINRNPHRPRSDCRIRIAVSIPPVQYSDAVQNRLYSNFQLCNDVLKTLSIDQQSVFESTCSLNGFNLTLRIVRTNGVVTERPVQGLWFLVSHRNSFDPTIGFERVRLRALTDLEPDVPIIVLFSDLSTDSPFEQIFRSRLPRYVQERLSFVNITAGSNLAVLFSESVQWFISNKIHKPTGSFVSLESIIRLRCNEIAVLDVDPSAKIPIFNKALLDIAQSIISESVMDVESEDLLRAKAMLVNFALPELDSSRSTAIRFNFADLASYVRTNFPGLSASEPVLSRMSLALSEGSNPGLLVSVIVSSRADSLLLRLYALELQHLLCSNVAPLSIGKNSSWAVPIVAPDVYVNDRSSLSSKKRNRDVPPAPSVRDLKRKLLESDRTSFNRKIEELLATICR